MEQFQRNFKLKFGIKIFVFFMLCMKCPKFIIFSETRIAESARKHNNWELKN